MGTFERHKYLAPEWAQKKLPVHLISSLGDAMPGVLITVSWLTGQALKPRSHSVMGDLLLVQSLGS